ncbi:mechanosensitive ion channel family protein [Telmatospirillum sp.]|uniref:mechanosensitive ion channel family protein n=1 Tax=Telmatospirillum sp. TaxID=2079197 RepID=UPI00284A9D86|nr:mechanosensitive ion channel family protein [Telmatospirillum sp.]MDR3441108.1 mechanosensitive ion channel family protein [Telmatospirillum sp.]
MSDSNERQTPSPAIADNVEKAMGQATEHGNRFARTQRTHTKQSLHWHIIGLTFSLVIAAIYFVFGYAVFGITEKYAPIISHFLLAVPVSTLILVAQNMADSLITRRLPDDNITLFNLRLVVRLISIVLICLVFLSAISQTWYTVVVSLGVFSIIAGFALQMPMTSFIGWIFILARRPYRVGDRIKIGSATGDVIDISYFDTTLWEFGGQYLSTDHPSGRVIKLPNSTVLTTPVYNYSWPLFPYIWDEIKFNIAYNSDLDFVSGIMIAVAREEMGATMAERVRAYRSVLDETPIDQIEVSEEPTVFFRVNENAWLDANVRYLVDPKESGRMKTLLIRKMLTRLNAEPDRVLFPKGR